MCQLSLHILNFNFQLCSRSEHKVFIHRTSSTCYKTIKRENILKYYFIRMKLYSKFQLNVPELRYRPASLNIKSLLHHTKSLQCNIVTPLRLSSHCKRTGEAKPSEAKRRQARRSEAARQRLVNTSEFVVE